jgi:hypothetical protein
MLDYAAFAIVFMIVCVAVLHPAATIAGRTVGLALNHAFEAAFIAQTVIRPITSALQTGFNKVAQLGNAGAGSTSNEGSSWVNAMEFGRETQRLGNLGTDGGQRVPAPKDVRGTSVMPSHAPNTTAMNPGTARTAADLLRGRPMRLRAVLAIRLDALRLVRCFRAGELTAILVPSKEQEALRDLLRALNGAKRDQISHMHQLAKFLIRQGRHKPKGAGLMSTKYLMWARVQQFEQAAHREVLTHYLLEFEHSTQRLQELNKTLEEVCEQLPKPTAALVAALQALRGVAKLLAVSLVSELGSLSRFRTPRQLMSYAGVVSREHSSGGKTRRGAITKSGNAHLRRVIVEAA